MSEQADNAFVVEGKMALPYQYFAGATGDAHRLGAFNLMYLTLAQRAVELNLRVFDFGRSRRDNAGCCNFKRFQGFAPTPLEYQCEAVSGRQPPNLTPSNPRFSLARRIRAVGRAQAEKEL